jgi:acyl carrier protein
MTDVTAETVTGGWSDRDPRIEEVLDIVAKETLMPRDKLVPEAVITDLGITSLDLTQAVFALETHFDIEIPVIAAPREDAGASAAEFVTVGDLVDHVMATLARRATA